MHEFSIRTMEPGDAIKNITPEIIIVSLHNNTVIFTKSELCASKHGRAGEFLKHHRHFPFKEYLIFVLCDRRNIHVQLFATLCQSIA